MTPECTGQGSQLEAEVREILSRATILNACNDGSEKAGWGRKFRFIGPLMQNRRDVGQTIGIDIVTEARTASMIDFAGAFVWVFCLYDKPDELVVISNNEPVRVSLRRPGWNKKLSKAVRLGCEKPGTFTDYERGERVNNFLYFQN